MFYSGGIPEFFEADVFKQIIPITENVMYQQDRFTRIMEFCSDTWSNGEIMAFLGLKDRVNFRNDYLLPLIHTGKLLMTIPDKPTSRNQKYVAKK